MFPPQAVCKCFCVARVIKLSVELNNYVVMRAPQGCHSELLFFYRSVGSIVFLVLFTLLQMRQLMLKLTSWSISPQAEPFDPSVCHRTPEFYITT